MMNFKNAGAAKSQSFSIFRPISRSIVPFFAALPLLGAVPVAFAQSPLTDEPAPLKFLFKQQIPLPPDRPQGFEPVNPMEPPKSDVSAPAVAKAPEPKVPEPAAPSAATPAETPTAKLPLQPLSVPNLAGSDTVAPLPKLPSTFASPLFATAPLPPVRPKEIVATLPAEPPPAMPMAIDKPKVIHGNQQKLEPIKELPKDEVIKKASAVLSEMTQFQAEFTQIDGTGRKVTGHLAVARPGRLRFDYDAPSNIVVIADGTNVGVIDRRLKTRDVYSLFLTPLKFLLKGTIDLAADITIIDIRSEAETYVIVAEDKSTFAGTSKIALSFDKRSLKITQWTVTDPQGYDTTVILGPIDTSAEPDPDLFVIPQTVG